MADPRISADSEEPPRPTAHPRPGHHARAAAAWATTVRAASAAAETLARTAQQRFVTNAAAVRQAWLQSLQLRIVTITLVASGLLVGAFGYLVVELTTRSLLSAADREAQEQVQYGAERAGASLRALGGPTSGQPLASEVRSQVLDPLTSGPERGKQVIVVLALPGQDTAPVAAPALDVPVTEVVSDELAAAVADGMVSRQIITTRLFEGGEQVTYLVYGSPLPSNAGGSGTSLYHVFPLTAEVNAANNIRTIVLATGATLVLLLAVVAGLVTRLVVRPVRVAARTAQRLSAGLLDQRMAVSGQDDLALLAASFNQMAGNLQRQIVRLEDMSRLQRRFTSDVSHELRTPLTTVRMAADLIFSERAGYSPEVARSAELLQHELDRFEALLTDLLEISRFDAGFAALDSEPVDLVPVVRQAVDRLAAICERAGTEVVLHLPDEGVIAEVDARRVDRILRNLVENAAEHGEGRPVEVTLAGGEAAAAITVRDHGVGLRPEEHELIFNRFWRADASRARQSGGTGLGLSISVEDARLHGGWLEAWGRPGQGTQLRLTLPLRAGDRLVSSPLPLVPPEVDPFPPAEPTLSGAGTRP